MPAERMFAMALSLWMLVASCQARADDSREALDLDTLAPQLDAIRGAAKDAARRGCLTPACIAVIRLRHIFEIIDDGSETTMGDARYLNPDQPYVEERRLHAVLLDHPDRFGPMCALLTSIASRYGRIGARQSVDEDLYVGVEAVYLAVRMDGTGPPDCLPAVLAAMPPTVEADTAIDSEKTLCENEPVARDPCARIVRPCRRSAGSGASARMPPAVGCAAPASTTTTR